MGFLMDLCETDIYSFVEAYGPLPPVALQKYV